MNLISININEAAKLLSISVPMLRKLVSAKQIPFFRIGRRVLFSTSELELWVHKKQQKEEN